jgi:hypothetical protein
VSIPIANWDKNELKKLALKSGRPLEIQCAEAFLKARWQVRLGTFYNDIASEKIRELDVLAEKKESFQITGSNRDAVEMTLCVRILGSCKGFAPEHGPAIYSVFANSPSVQKPRVMCYETELRGKNFADSMRQQCAKNFLHSVSLSTAQQIVGFDIIQCREDQRKPPQVEYLRKTDRDLYEGLDSALKAALFWYQEDKRQGKNRYGGNSCYVAVNIPLLVTSLPFWNVSIEGGNPGEPELKSSGFHVSLYPSGDKEKPPQSIMSILWEAAKLEELTRHLDQLFEFIVDEAKIAKNI